MNSIREKKNNDILYIRDAEIRVMDFEYEIDACCIRTSGSIAVVNKKTFLATFTRVRAQTQPRIRPGPAKVYLTLTYW